MGPKEERERESNTEEREERERERDMLAAFLLLSDDKRSEMHPS